MNRFENKQIYGNQTINMVIARSSKKFLFFKLNIIIVSKIFSQRQPGAVLSWFDLQTTAALQGSEYLQRLRCDESANEF